MRILKSSLAGLFLVTGIVTLAVADVKVEVTNSTFELRGLTSKAIHDDLHRVAQKDGDGVIEGEVNDDLTWQLTFAEAGGTCRVTSDAILLKLQVTLPVWVDEAHAEPEVRAVWNTYYKDLKAHEDGHRAIAEQAAERISKVTHLATAPGACSTLKASLESEARQIAESAEADQDKHDATAAPFALE
jgi:predicted secreted Zn-dependent protease